MTLKGVKRYCCHCFFVWLGPSSSSLSPQYSYRPCLIQLHPKMWNSLWSIYDGGGANDVVTPAEQPLPSSSRTASSNRGRACLPSTTNLQTSLHSTSSNSSGSKRLLRMKQPPIAEQCPVVDNTTILRGIIVGEKESGKSCLIRRLRGEDPCNQYDRRGHDVGTNGIRGNESSTSRRSQRNLMALIPWKVPEEVPFHQTHQKEKHHTIDIIDNDLVQLYISEGKSFSYSSQQKEDNEQQQPLHKQWMSVLQSQKGKEYDFVVWMIDPRMENILEFLRDGLDILFPLATTIANNNRNDDFANGTQSIKHPRIQHLCILLNFRDIEHAKESGTKEESLIDQMQQIIEQVSTRRSSGSYPTILLYESSMKNCYGLQNLHSFITLPYLSHKERELQRRADNARKERLLWKQGLMEAKAVQYDDFVKHVIVKEKPKEPTAQSLQRQKLKEEKERLQQRVKQQDQLLQQSKSKRDGKKGGSVSNSQREQIAVATKSSSTSQSSDRFIEKGTRDAPPVQAPRQILSQSRQATAKNVPRPSAVTEHTNLESFFSDDEEDDQAQSDTNSNDSSDSSDDEEDDDGDFFIDVSGTRVSHANVPLRIGENGTKMKGIPKKKGGASNLDREGVDVSAKEEDSKLKKQEHETCDNSKDESDSVQNITKKNDSNDAHAESIASVKDQSAKVDDTEQVDSTNLEAKKNEEVDAAKEDGDDKKISSNDAEVTTVEGVDNTSDEAFVSAEDDANIEGVDTDDSANDTAEKDSSNGATDFTPVEVAVNENSQRQLVIDSDDESTGVIEDESIQNRMLEVKDESDEGLTHDKFVAGATQQSQESTATKQSDDRKVSSAALAAIEAAKREAELMMAKSTESTSSPSPKREKKSKKKKEGDKKKKKKKLPKN